MYFYWDDSLIVFPLRSPGQFLKVPPQTTYILIYFLQAFSLYSLVPFPFLFIKRILNTNHSLLLSFPVVFFFPLVFFFPSKLAPFIFLSPLFRLFGLLFPPEGTSSTSTVLSNVQNDSTYYAVKPRGGVSSPLYFWRATSSSENLQASFVDCNLYTAYAC